MKSLYFENKISKVIALKAASLFNRYAALGRFSPLSYADVAEPEIPNERWLKVKNRSCGLCGTDLHFMFMEMDPKCFPAAVPGITVKDLGHELVGEVVSVGNEVGEIAVGERVAMRIDWPSCFQMEIAPPCPRCATGDYMLCENLGKKPQTLEHTGGGFSAFMVMHRSQPYRIPDSLNHEQALLLEPMASALHGVLKAPPLSGEKILVIGGGTIGLLSVAAVRWLEPNAEVYCVVRHDFQAAVVEKLGGKVIYDGKELYPTIAKTTGARHHRGYFGNQILLGGFDTIYDTVCNDKSFNNALRWVRGQGRIVLVGINFQPGKIDYTTIWNQEIQLTGINCHAQEGDRGSSFDVAAGALSDGAVEPSDIITHHFPMREYKQAVKAFLNKRESKAIKIVLDHE